MIYISDLALLSVFAERWNSDGVEVGTAFYDTK